jgi:ribonuclease HI
VNVEVSVSSLGSILSDVAQSDSGQVVRAWTKPSIFTDLLVAEAYACLWGLQLALEEKFQSIVLESDSQICVNALSSHNPDGD